MNLLNRFIKKPYEDIVKNPNNFFFEVNKWELSRFVIEKLIPVVGVGPFSLDEQMLMAGSVCGLKPTVIFEWGTHIGKSARIFYETVKAFHLDIPIHSTDLPDNVYHIEHPGHNRGILVKGKKGVTLHQGDGVDTSISICKKMKGDIRPFFFLDGDHSFLSVKREMQIILSEFPNSNILIHDTFNQSKNSRYNTGPYLAIRRVLSKKRKKYVRMELTMGLPGMTLIYHI